MNTKNEVKEQEKYIEKIKKVKCRRREDVEMSRTKKIILSIIIALVGLFCMSSISSAYYVGQDLTVTYSEKLCGMLEEMGYIKTENPKESDLSLFNTCCVRENAEDKLFGKLGELKKVKEERGTIIAIGGCMMQEKHITSKIKESYPFVDVIFGTHTLHRFPEDLYKALVEKKKQEDILKIRTGGEIYCFHYEEIQYLEARDKKIILHVNKYEISFYSSLQKLEKSLPDYFIRCHRSYIVNFMFIQKADLINGEFYLNKKTVIPISQKYKAKLAKML